MRKAAPDSGFTLIEVLVAISLASILMAFAVSGWSGWARASQQSGAARGLQAALRQTQQRAVTEGGGMCVSLADATYTVWRGSCATPVASRTRIDGPVQVAKGVHLAPVGTEVSFSARGTATSGTLTVSRDGSTKVYTLQVEGFTGRVALS